jgi:hypothetical protein
MRGIEKRVKKGKKVVELYRMRGMNRRSGEDMAGILVTSEAFAEIWKR